MISSQAETKLNLYAFLSDGKIVFQKKTFFCVNIFGQRARCHENIPEQAAFAKILLNERFLGAFNVQDVFVSSQHDD